MFDGRRGLRKSSGGASSVSLLAPLVHEFGVGRTRGRGGVADEVDGGAARCADEGAGSGAAAAAGRVGVHLVTMPAAKLAASMGLPPPLDEVGALSKPLSAVARRTLAYSPEACVFLPPYLS